MAKSSGEGTSTTSDGGTSVILKDRFRIHLDSPLEELDSPTAKAFLANDLKNDERPLFALVCETGVPYRAKTLSALTGREIPYVLPVSTAGVVRVRAAKKFCFELVLQRPRGPRLSTLLGPGGGPISETFAVTRLLPALAEALEGLAAFDLAHRALRPDNIFFVDADRTELALGECVSAPAGSGQPMVYEPVERAMASPAGRGEGNPACDCYALGAVLVALLSGKNPAAGIDERELLQARIVKGSFRALTRDVRFPGAISELIRELLCDDSSLRASAADIKAWCQNRRLNVKPGAPARQARRPFVFRSREILYDRTLANAFGESPAEAARVIQSGNVEAWVRGDLEDAKGADLIGPLVSAARPSTGVPSERDDAELVGQFCRVLDPLGPIRFGSLAVAADGIGGELADAIRKNDGTRVSLVADLLRRDLATDSIQSRGLSGVKKTAALGLLLRLRGHVANGSPGFGIERCLYELNPSLPCMSPLVARLHANGVHTLLLALNRVATAADESVELLDAHVAAFIAEKWENGQRRLSAVASAGSDEMGRRLAVLRLLAALQSDVRSGPLVGLTGWFAKRLDSLVSTYRNRNRRSELMRRLEQITAGGDLQAMAKLFRSYQGHDLDERAYHRAVAEYAALERGVLRLKAEQDGIPFATSRLTSRIVASAGYSLLMVSVVGAVIAAAL